MKARAPKIRPTSRSAPARSAAKPKREKPVTPAPRDPLFESLRQELGL